MKASGIVVFCVSGVLVGLSAVAADYADTVVHGTIRAADEKVKG